MPSTNPCEAKPGDTVKKVAVAVRERWTTEPLLQLRSELISGTGWFQALRDRPTQQRLEDPFEDGDQQDLSIACKCGLEQYESCG